MKQPLPVIPTPLAKRLHEFRVQFLPVIVFGCALSAIFTLWRAHFLPPRLVSEAESIAAEAGPASGAEIGALTNVSLVRAQGALVQAITR